MKNFVAFKGHIRVSTLQFGVKVQQALWEQLMETVVGEVTLEDQVYELYVFIVIRWGICEWDCRKLHNWNLRAEFAHMRSTKETLDQLVLISTDEFTKF